MAANLINDIYTILTANANVVSTFSTRIYPVLAPNKVTLPCIVWRVTSITPNENKTYKHSLDDITIELLVIDDKVSDIELYAQYVRTAMDSYQGTISSDKIKGVGFRGLSWEALDDRSYSSSPQGVSVFAAVMSFRILATLDIAE